MKTHAAPAIAAFAALLAGGAGGWQMIIPAGQFTARDGRGPFVAGDRSAMEAIVAATRAYHDRTEIVVDYDHQSLQNGEGGAAKAAGWIRALETRDDGIWADIEWTPAAAQAIGAKEYRYLSPLFAHDKADGRIRMILSVGLTNTPALHLEALSARLDPLSLDRSSDMEKILAALGLAKGSGEDAVLSALNALLAGNTAIATALGLDAQAKPADVQAALTALTDGRKRLLEAAGLSADAKPEEAVAALTALKGRTAPDPTKFVPVEQVTALQADVKALREELDGGKAEAAVADAMKAGKLVPALRDWGVQLFRADPAKFKTFIDGQPALTEQQLKPKPVPGSDGVAALSAAHAAAAKALGIDPKAYAETLKAESAAAL